MFGSAYPHVKRSLAWAALKDAPPALILDNRCVVQAANLMAFWLWGKLPAEGPLDPAVFLGTSVFDAVAGSVDRIPLAKNIEAFSKASAIVRRLNATPGADPALYALFIAAMHVQPNHAYLYDHCEPYPDREGEYVLTIAPPDQTDSATLLDFDVTAYRLAHDGGFLVTYALKPTTFLAVETRYARLSEQFGASIYALPADQPPALDQLIPAPTDYRDFMRSYYPMLIQDPLWYIVKENKANRLLLGQSVVGAHFFEMFFSPELRAAMGPAHETSAPRAIKYFDTFTEDFQREDHDLHEAYWQTMQRVLQIPGFREVRALYQRIPLKLHMPEQPGDPFYTCRVLMPWPFAQEIILQFRNIVCYLYNDAFAQEDLRHYQVMLVPENYETDVVLILLHLMPNDQLAPNAEDDALKPFLWGLAMVTTIQEGLTGNNEGGVLWEPESAFARLSSALAAEYPRAVGVAIGIVIARIRAVIDSIHAVNLVDKQTLLLLLRSVTATQPGLDRLTRFLTGEQALSEQANAGQEQGLPLI
ncbi:MAG TPA: hypothetical protein VNE61_08600 [Ktedonobacteraceae bacterium]|nr:hypothetical protein [Ktedonobacteraceae bacterium]